MQKQITFFAVIFLLLVASALASPIIGSMDGLTFGTDFGAWWISESSTFNLLLNDYNDWYTVYVSAVDATGCNIGTVTGSNVPASAIPTEYVPLNTVIEVAGTELGVYQVDLTPPSIRCRVAYNFASLGPVSSTTDTTEETDYEEIIEADVAEAGEFGELMEIASCTDGDNGRAPHIASEVITTFTTGGYAPHPDTCLNTNTLREYYCTGRNEEGNPDNYTYLDYDCPGGCVAGECVHEVCQDSDGGNKKFIAGTMTHDFADISSPVKDYCYSENSKMVEYFCASGLQPANPELHNSYSYRCTFGCITEESGGRCRKVSELLQLQAAINVFNFWLGNGMNNATEQASVENYEWVLNSYAQDVLEWPLIRAWDQGDFETDLKCPEGYMVSTIEMASEVYFGAPQIRGITLYCARAGGEHLLNVDDTTTRSWNVYSSGGGFTPYEDSLITGLKGYYSLGGLSFIKTLDVRQTQYIYNNEVGYTVGGSEMWLDIPTSFPIITTANVIAYCGASDATSQRTSVSGLSGLRIYSTERGNDEIVSALQPRCSTLERTAAN